jgi:hypothetical protein
MTSKGTTTEDTPQILQEQASPPLSRVMSMDRGPFKDKMKGDPFEYEILGDPCNKPEEVTFKVIAFSAKASPGYRGRHGGKIGTRVLEKGRFIFPKTAKYRKLKLAGKDSWEILRTTLGGADLICDRVTKAEEKEKKAEPVKKAEEKPEKKADAPTATGGRTAGKPAETGKKSTPKKTTSGPKPGTLKYWVENDKTGVTDRKTKKDLRIVGSGEAKRMLAQAIEKFINSKADSRFHNVSTLGYSLNRVNDRDTGFSDKYPEATDRLKAVLHLIDRNFLDSVYGLKHGQLLSGPLANKTTTDLHNSAQKGADELADYLGMDFFKKGVNEALKITTQQLNSIVLNELKSLGIINPKQEENMKITKGQLRQIIREEMSHMDNDLDTNNDGQVSVGELEAELEDIKDDLEMESFEVMLHKAHGKRVERRIVHVDVNVAGHESPRESKEAAKKVAEEKYPGYSAAFAESDEIGGLEANL